MGDNKQRGAYYEQLFITECLQRELHPHPSIGDYLPHDIIVQNNAGRLLRVQIKGTMVEFRDSRNCKDGKERTRYRITAKAGRGAGMLDCKLVDVIAGYVTLQKAWYLIPCTRVTSRAIWLYPHVPASKAQYEPFRERWDIFS